jgi:hypothetical protein
MNGGKNMETVEKTILLKEEMIMELIELCYKCQTDASSVINSIRTYGNSIILKGYRRARDDI